MSKIMAFLYTFAALTFTSAEAVIHGRDPFPVDQYVLYQGDGSGVDGWPTQDEWCSFDDLWSSNMALIGGSCGWNGWGADNSLEETAALRESIEELSDQSGIDRRFIFSIILQESKGCVRAPTTNNGVENPGLMQSHAGEASCATNNPCPASVIRQMVADGVAGTSTGDGLEQTVESASSHLGPPDSRAYYAAARLYNSGSVDYTDLNNGFSSTACYVVDIVNRLKGWVSAVSLCLA